MGIPSDKAPAAFIHLIDSGKDKALSVAPNHTHDDTIISAAESLLRERAAKFLTHASNMERSKDTEPEYRAALNIAARCTFAATAVEGTLQAVADFHIRYDTGEDSPDAA